MTMRTSIVFDEDVRQALALRLARAPKGQRTMHAQVNSACRRAWKMKGV